MTAQIVTVVCLFAAFYIGGVGHGVAVGYTWERRMRRWASTVAENSAREPEPGKLEDA